MRLNEITVENQPTQEEIRSIVSKIRSDCKPYLKSNPKPLAELALYRGILKTNKAWFVDKKTRLQNRQSTMPSDIKSMINKFFVTKFSKPFRDSALVTGNVEMAQLYDTAYIIFPKGPFTFLWSPVVEDLWSIIYMDYNFKNMDYEKFENNVLSTYKNTDLINAIQSNNEVMLRCESYYAVRADMANLLGEL